MPSYKRPDPRPLLEIANQYLQNELPAANAATRLRKGGPLGNLLAGEILLDSASVESPYMVTTLVRTATRNYKTVISQTETGAWRDGYDHAGSRFRAQIRLAQIGIFQEMYRIRSLPEHSTVKNGYNQLLRCAIPAIDSTRDNRQSRADSAVEVRGTLCEVAVLLLAQRYALREVGCEDWLPLQSSFTEDSGGNCLTTTDAFAWDMNIFTPSDSEKFPEKTYSLQVKSRDREDAPPAAGPTIYVSPDLGLSPNEQWIAEKIIAACDIEKRVPAAASARITRELDIRTEKFLDIIG